MSKILTLVAGAGKAQLNEIPQFLYLEPGITSLTVTSATRGTIVNLKTPVALQQASDMVSLAAGTGYALQLGDGAIRNESITIEATGGGTESVFGWSQNVGQIPFEYNSILVNANSSANFDKFFNLGLEGMGTGFASITFKDGQSANLTVAELQRQNLFYATEATANFSNNGFVTNVQVQPSVDCNVIVYRAKL